MFLLLNRYSYSSVYAFTPLNTIKHEARLFSPWR